MTVLDDVRDYIIRHRPRPLCDDCIAEGLELSVRQHANHKTRELALMRGFERTSDTCSRCGRVKMVIRSKSI
ncbi:hypothetical protein GCM10011392_08190 [Wenxinia marina]|uniref:Uncharacterized protein n=1 Tax=Wenxinia marina DSM 24838 TaxID=1123501 RepID=A0A0D0PHS6_9RHOB|nr:hypothetical protein Wenmar_00316 [Wenxinia marina DSM 24838]GGL56130.1 hypothetical protein GCM10011392_08190 [Wenxinia marina]